MKVTNKYNLPSVFEHYSQSQKYSRGEADYSVTQLIDSPRVSVLKERHADDITVDVSDMAYALFGTAVHQVMESGSHFDSISEERLFLNVNGVVMSGQIDLQEMIGNGEVDVTDFKTCSTWAAMNAKADWERQINLYCFLVERCKPLKVRNAYICAIIRDWSETLYDQRKRADPKTDYPPSPIIRIEVPIWSMAQRTEYVLQRISTHGAAIRSSHSGADLPLCSDEDRWKREDRYKLVKKGSTRAYRTADSREEAEESLAKLSDKIRPDYRIKLEKGTAVRCERNYCNVSEWCSQFKEKK